MLNHQYLSTIEPKDLQKAISGLDLEDPPLILRIWAETIGERTYTFVRTISRRGQTDEQLPERYTVSKYLDMISRK